MKTAMKQLIDELRHRVMANLNAVRINELEIRQILTEPNSKERSEKLSSRFSLNKRILEENKDNIEIQNHIINFLTLYKEIPDFSEKIKSLKGFEQELDNKSDDGTSNIENNSEKNASSHSQKIESELRMITKKQTAGRIFDLTISGKMEYTIEHPLFNNEEFFERLFNHYLTMEDYEKCAELKILKGI